MKITLRKQDAVWSYLGIFVSMGASFLLLPFILLYLDNDSVGLYYIFISLGALAQLFDFGFNPAFARNVAYCWSGATELSRTGGMTVSGTETDFRLFRDVLDACRFVYRLISTIAFGLILVFGIFYISYLSRDVSGNTPEIAWLIYAIALFLNLYFGYYSVFLRGVGAIAEINKATIFAKLIQIVGTVVLLYMGFGLIGTSIGYLAYGIAFRILARHSFLRFHGIGACLETIPGKAERDSVMRIVKTIWYNAWRDGLVSVSTYLLGQAGTIVSSLFLSLELTGIYSLSVQLTVAIASIAATFHSMNQPVLQSAYITGNKERQKSLLSFNVLSFVFLFLAGMALLIAIGLPLVRWMKPSFVISVPVILAIGVYQFILYLRNCYATYLSTTNRVIYYKAFIVSAGICVGLEFLLTGSIRLGVWGLVIAQLTSQLIYNAWKWPFFVHHELNLLPKDMFKTAYAELRILFSKL